MNTTTRSRRLLSALCTTATALLLPGCITTDPRMGMVASVAGGALQAFVSGQQHYMQMQQGNMSYQMQQQPYGNMGGGYADPGQNYGGMPAGYSGYGPQPSCGGGYSGN